MAYLNGQVPSGALVGISGRGGARLLAGPAASWERGCDEVERRFGWRPAPSGPSDAYREIAVQIVTFLDRYVAATTGGGYYGDVRWWNGVRYVRKQGKAAAAVPGTSNHGKGRAVDVTGLGGFTGIRYAQFASVFIPLGWSNAEGRSVNEPWHWVDLLSPETVSSGHAVIPGVSVPVGPTGSLTPLVPEEDIVASRAELQADLASAINPVLAAVAAVGTPRAYRPENTDGAYLDVGAGRVALTGARLATLDPKPAIRPLPVDDPFWALPVYGPPSQAFRRQGDATGAVFYLEGGAMVHVDAARYAADGKPTLKDLPGTHAVWSLPVRGA
jgi:hypothetical protein